MGYLIFILLTSFFVGYFYSLMMQKFFRSKIILLIPTLIGIIVFIYTIFIANPYEAEGLNGLNIVIWQFIFALIILGNVIGLLLVRFNRNQN